MNFWNSFRARAAEMGNAAALLVVRLWVAQEFVQAGWLKLTSGWHAPEWFAGLSFPWPVAWLPVDVNWVAAGLGEVGFGVALALGLFTRWAAAGLLFITWVAVATVHFDLGWAGWNQIETDMGQGFKVPLMLAVMLVVPLLHGAGGWAFDRLRLNTRRMPDSVCVSSDARTTHGWSAVR